MKEKIKNFIKKTIFFKMYVKYISLKNRKRKQLENMYFKKEGLELLQHFSDVLNAEKIMFWLDFGTLLGYYREHDFIAHDDDIDIGAHIEDAPKIREALEKSGFELVKHFHTVKDNNLEECYRYKHTLIDIFYFQPEGKNMYCYIYFPYNEGFFPKHYEKGEKRPYKVDKVTVFVESFDSVLFKDIKVNVPHNIENYLAEHYGDDYMTPNPKFSRKEVSKNTISLPYNEAPAYAYLYI